MAYTTTARQSGNKKGGASQKHNMRETEYLRRNDIDETLHNEVWKHEDCEQAYERIFGSALKAFNEKQKREDRKIKNYFEKIENDKQKNTYYEIIFSMGTMEDKLYKNYKRKDEPLFKETCHEIALNFETQYPNLKVIGAYYHQDEKGVNHMHLDYIPVAYNQTRGLNTQTSLEKALEQMGFKDTEDQNKLTKFNLKVRDDLDRRLREKGIELKPHEKGRDKRLSVKDYKKFAKEVEENLTRETKGLFKKTPTERAEIIAELRQMRAEDSKRMEGLIKENRAVLEETKINRKEAEEDRMKAEGLTEIFEMENEDAIKKWKDLKADIKFLEEQKKELESNIKMFETERDELNDSFMKEMTDEVTEPYKNKIREKEKENNDLKLQLTQQETKHKEEVKNITEKYESELSIQKTEAEDCKLAMKGLADTLLEYSPKTQDGFFTSFWNNLKKIVRGEWVKEIYNKFADIFTEREREKAKEANKDYGGRSM